MTKDVLDEKTKAYLKKMRKALKKAPIVMVKTSEDPLPAITDAVVGTWEQLNWTEDRRLQNAREQLFSRLSNDERYEARKWVVGFDQLTRGDE
jgi:hypothetical protein